MTSPRRVALAISAAHWPPSDEPKLAYSLSHAQRQGEEEARRFLPLNPRGIHRHRPIGPPADAATSAAALRGYFPVSVRYESRYANGPASLQAVAARPPGLQTAPPTTRGPRPAPGEYRAARPRKESYRTVCPIPPQTAAPHQSPVPVAAGHYSELLPTLVLAALQSADA